MFWVVIATSVACIVVGVALSIDILARVRRNKRLRVEPKHYFLIYALISLVFVWITIIPAALLQLNWLAFLAQCGYASYTYCALCWTQINVLGNPVTGKIFLMRPFVLVWFGFSLIIQASCLVFAGSASITPLFLLNLSEFKQNFWLCCNGIITFGSLSLWAFLATIELFQAAPHSKLLIKKYRCYTFALVGVLSLVYNLSSLLELLVGKLFIGDLPHTSFPLIRGLVMLVVPLYLYLLMRRDDYLLYVYERLWENQLQRSYKKGMASLYKVTLEVFPSIHRLDPEKEGLTVKQSLKARVRVLDNMRGLVWRAEALRRVKERGIVVDQVPPLEDVTFEQEVEMLVFYLNDKAQARVALLLSREYIPSAVVLPDMGSLDQIVRSYAKLGRAYNKHIKARNKKEQKRFE